MVKLLLVALLALPLTSCAGDGTTPPPYYQTQGENLTECGPAVGAMAVTWAGGTADRFSARKYSTYPRWWAIGTLRGYIMAQGVRAVWADGKTIVPMGKLGVYHVNGNHFVVVQNNGNNVTVSDPLRGVYTTSASGLLGIVSYKYYIEVSR